MSLSLTEPGRFVIGCNYWASHAGTNMWSDWQPAIVAEDLRQLASHGLQVLRVFPLWPDFQPIQLLRGGGGAPREVRLGEGPLPDDAEGQAGLSAVMLERFQTFADLAETAGLKLIVGLLTGWMSGRLYVPPALEGLNVLSDPFALMWETRFVRAFVRRFKRHPAVLAWDLGNECNVMAPVSAAAAWAWVSAITNAIRVEDATRPVVSGMHGDLNTFTTPMLGELTDLLTTHPYPIWTEHCDQDPVNTIRAILHAAAESRLYADTSGKPCLAEEVGTLGPMLASDCIAADFVRASLFSLWAHDCHGLLWWCAFDQDHLEHAPYDWNTCERELGLMRWVDTEKGDGEKGREGKAANEYVAKPVIKVMQDFRRFLEGLPVETLPPRRSEAVCLLSADQDQWGVAYSAFVLASQAGFDLEFQYGEQPLKPARLYLVPSVRGINVISRRRWLALLEQVRQGAALYLSLDDALLPGFRELFGLEVQVRSKRSGPAHLSIDGLGELQIETAIRQELHPAGAAVLGRELDGNPAFTRFSYGQGKVYFLSVPIERALARTPGGFHGPQAQPFWRIYTRVAEDILRGRVVHKDQPMLGLTEHPLGEHRRVIVAINYSPDRLEDTLALAPGWRLDEVWRGVVEADGRLSLGPNEAAVFTMRSEPAG